MVGIISVAVHCLRMRLDNRMTGNVSQESCKRTQHGWPATPNIFVKGRYIHQPTAWPVPHVCAQPYHLDSSNHEQRFRLYWGSQYGIAVRSNSSSTQLICGSCWLGTAQQFNRGVDVTCYVRLHTLLHLRVVGSCRAKFENGQTFSYVQMDAAP